MNVMAEPFIHLSGVKKIYRTRGKEFLAVSQATFDVEEGELVALVGRSGCKARKKSFPTSFPAACSSAPRSHAR